MRCYERMESSVDRFSVPSTCFRVKSWCNRWLSIDPDNWGKITFVERQEDSCGICLLPCEDGRYMLHLLLERNLRVHPATSSQGKPTEAVVQDRSKAESLREEQAQDDSDLRNGDAWFLCRQGQLVCVSQTANGSHDKDFHFSLEFDQNGYVRLRGGIDNGYWTSDSRGHLLASAQKAKKRESFQLIEYSLQKYAKGPAWMSSAPVRVNLKSHTGKYLCSARSLICAAAEVPCCCEEFLLDINFPPIPSFWESLKEYDQCAELLSSERQSAMNTVGSEKQTYSKKDNDLVARSKCMIRSSDGMHNLSADTDGKLSTVRHDQAQGHETFTVQLLSQKGHPKVSICHCNNVKIPEHLCYVSVEPSGKVISNKLHRHEWEEFSLNLANGSRILIQSVHGGFVGSEMTSDYTNALSFSRQLRGSRIEEKTSRRVCLCPLKSQEGAPVGVWRLRAHGDSLYTLLAATLPRDCGDVYLFVDAGGRVLQSGEPGVHFPAIASLFEIKPVTAACITGRTRDTGGAVGMDAAVMGFTIRTVRKVNGKQRFLTAEPNGMLMAKCIRASRWEIFGLVDVDATASTVSPLEYVCLPAAVNLNAPAALSTLSSPPRRGLAAPLMEDEQVASVYGSRRNDFRALQKHNHVYTKHTVAWSTQSLDYLKKASRVAAAAVWEGRTVPARVPASLQDLCIHQICVQACTEVPLVELGNLLSSTIPMDSVVENSIGIPDDLFARIRMHLRERQHPENSCKSLPSAFTLQNGPLPQNSRNGHTPTNATQQSLLEGNGEGFHCHSCNQDGVLKMDPTLNPAHHRYLEVQYHVQSEMTQPTGFLWNLISFAGVSIMSTVLLFQFFGNGNKRQKSRNRR